MSHILDNYKQLTARVDALCKGIEAALGAQITCSAGCSSCCTSITVFPVEATALREALAALPEAEAEVIRRHVSERADGEHCPLLSHHRCLLYAARPIICRTHGLPIIYSENLQRKSDCCPHNLADSAPLSGTSVVDLDRLNPLLVAVNGLYLSQADLGAPPERLTIAEVITRHPR